MDSPPNNPKAQNRNLSYSGRLFAILVAAVAGWSAATIQTVQAQQQPVTPSGQRPNILVIWGDDVGLANVSAYSFGIMGIKTPNIDRIGREGLMFTDYYAEQSCTAGRASFVTGQSGLRTGMTKVGLPGAALGLQPEDITIAEALKPLGYATSQFRKPTNRFSFGGTARACISTPMCGRNIRGAAVSANTWMACSNTTATLGTCSKRLTISASLTTP